MLARDMPVFAERAGIGGVAQGAKFIMVEEAGVGAEYPFSGEKLSLALTLYKARDFAAAKARANEILSYQGAGHSVGIHTQTEGRPLELGLELPACRVIVNQAHCFANGGSFDNALPFSLSMGCGTWGQNSICDNMNFRHYINTVRVVRAIPPNDRAWKKFTPIIRRRHKEKIKCLMIPVTLAVKRPMGIMLISMLHILAGVFIFAYLLFTLIKFSDVFFLDTQPIILLTLGGAMVLMAICLLISSYGLWKLKTWGDVLLSGFILY